MECMDVVRVARLASAADLLRTPLSMARYLFAQLLLMQSAHIEPGCEASSSCTNQNFVSISNVATRKD